MSAWIISGWVHLVVGFGLGWLVFKRPEWAARIVDFIWQPIKRGLLAIWSKITGRTNSANTTGT